MGPCRPTMLGRPVVYVCCQTPPMVAEKAARNASGRGRLELVGVGARQVDVLAAELARLQDTAALAQLVPGLHRHDLAGARHRLAELVLVVAAALAVGDDRVRAGDAGVGEARTDLGDGE